MKAAAIALVAFGLLAACAPGDDAAQPAGESPAPASNAAPAPAGDAAMQQDPTPDDGTQQDATPAAATGGTVGGDGSEIRLEALSASDLEGADLGGELGCSFSADGQPLLHAMGIVASEEPARGIVKVAGYVEPVRAPGGFDGMTRDPTFTGQGKTIRIVETGAAIGGGESPPRPATLTYQRADGASRTFEGRWQCGP
ncbi:hypothetical protein QFW77_16925 [Luteimonas sp. RD2P54]|uniref:DUF3455 domain-containing protein n=1 Tax=Luteimonas endophytica TaxID=3042023 RepID=A0ABT6JCV0_9GAMM|nr:hypothetical protein [Luteimonas endophytica]MDH5824656.1 hypothetical protein [Luteimonas endophytica]